MKIEKVNEFAGNDQDYFDWLAAHPNGFVMNILRSKALHSVVLHKADCKTISTRKVRPGGFTEREYIKICAEDVESLQRWVRQLGRADGSFSFECSLCKPT